MSSETNSLDQHQTKDGPADQTGSGGGPGEARTALSAQGLVKVYTGKERVKAVKGVDFEVNEGEFVSIIGPSGSGKSTILRMIAGFEGPTEGKVVLDNMDITDRAPFDRDTNMMFQDLALFPNYTVSENIAYGPKQSGIPEDERESMVEEMLEMVRLEGYGDRSIDELSGGEQQRVALARCMVNNPKLVLFDEPLASLDRQLRRDMTTELRNIQSETGSTFLYVTHNQQVALSVSDRVIVLNDGEIEQVGTPDDLYNDPQTEFVANFVGDMNMFVSDVVKGADTDETTDVGAHPVPLPASEPAPDGSELKVGVRPHEVDIAFDEDEVSGCYIEGEVNGTVFNGDRNVVTASTDKGEFISETEVDPSGGQSMYLHWPPAEMHFYATDGVDDE